MAFHTCTIQTLAGEEVAANVRVNVEEPKSDGDADWFGTISGEHLVSLEAGACYRLILGDGRVGEFCVRRNTVAGGEDRSVSFRGTGPLATGAL